MGIEAEELLGWLAICLAVGSFAVSDVRIVVAAGVLLVAAVAVGAWRTGGPRW